MTAANILDHLLTRLEEVRARCPGLRFGQLIATIGMLAEDETGLSLWDVEDAAESSPPQPPRQVS